METQKCDLLNNCFNIFVNYHAQMYELLYKQVIDFIFIFITLDELLNLRVTVAFLEYSAYCFFMSSFDLNVILKYYSSGNSFQQN